MGTDDRAPAPAPDAALVVAARRGDGAAFELLVRRHQGRVRAVVGAVCGHPVEAQDLAQEAFLRAWTNLDLIADPGRFAGWIARIAFACAIDWRRRRPPEAEVSAADAVASPETPAETALAEHQLRAAVRAAVARLPPRYRQPLVLYHLDGLRQDRIAAALGVPAGTVRSLVTRARQALREDLAALVGEDLWREPDPRALLHICNGHETMRPLAQAGVPGRFRLSVDPLLEGPCPPLWDEAWRRVRSQFLGDTYGPGAGPAPGEEIWDDDLVAALSPGGGVDEIVMWYEHDLYDQLLLIRLLAGIARHQGRRPPVSLVCIGEHPDVPGFMGLGQLGPDQLASLFETRTPVDASMIALGRDAWAAYSDPDPRRLEDLLARDLSALPFLARALRRHLEEYPGAGDGLSRSERALLVLVNDGVRDPARAWRALHLQEDCHYLADTWLTAMIDRLAAAPAPLLAVSGRVDLVGKSPGATISLTALGEEVLRGRADWLPLAGIDRWLGGVHLTDAASAWRWDARQGRLVR
jgi:RNA polymerase sigma factor (sigma-70 family)